MGVKVTRFFLAVGLLMALYAACGFFFVPWVAQRYGVPALESRLGRDIHVGNIRTNPFLLSAEARQVRLAGVQDEPMLTIERLLIDASLRGLVRGIWALDEVVAQGLAANVVLQRDGTLNFTELAGRMGGRSPEAGGGPDVEIGRLAVPDATVAVIDQRGAATAQVLLAPVTLVASNLSRASEQVGTHELTAALPEGGSLRWKGEIALRPAVAATGSIRAEDMQAQVLLPFLTRHVQLSQMKASMDFSARYGYDSGQSLRVSDMAFQADDVLLVRNGQEQPLLQAGRMAAAGGTIDTAQRTVTVGEVRLAKGMSRVAVAPDGTLNWASILATQPVEDARQAGNEASWTLRVPKAQVSEMALTYADRSAQQPMRLQADGLSAQLALSITTGPRTQVLASDVQAQWSEATIEAPSSSVPGVTIGPVTLENGRFDSRQQQVAAGELRVEGGQVRIAAASGASPAPAAKAKRKDAAGQPAADLDGWSVVLDRLAVADIGASYVTAAGLPPAVRAEAIDASLQLRMELGGNRTQVAAAGLDATVKGLVLAGDGSKQAPVEVALAKVSNGRFDLAARRVEAEKLALQGSARFVPGDGGAFEALAQLVPPAPRTAGLAPQGPAWRYSVDALEIPSLAFSFLDSTGNREPLELAGTLVGGARNVSSAGEASFDAKVSMSKGGSFMVRGTAASGGLKIRADVSATAVALIPFQPLLQRVADLRLASGTLTGAGQLSYERAGAEPSVLARSRLAIDGLALREGGAGDRFLAFKKLAVDDVSFDSVTRAVSAGEISIMEPWAKVVIGADRTVNLAEVFQRRDGKAGAPAAVGKPGPAFKVDVDRVRVRGGEIDFSDLSLVLPFSTTIKKVDGTIVDISNRPLHRAAVEAKGAVEPYGSASLEGSIVPFAPTEFTDLQLEFSNVQVPPLSPYTATFAGRKVESGKLWLDLRYRVEDGELLGRNDIRLSDFSLGERVQAPDALDLPLGLVVSLLTDANGDIRLSVPVIGDIGEPRFSVASAVRQAVGNVLKRIVSAPFRALGNLLDGNAEALATVDFEPGSAVLRPQQRERLDGLSRALRERPRLELVVAAPYDPQGDLAALQQVQARRALAGALGRNLGPDESAGPVAYDDPATRRALLRLLREHAGDQAIGDYQSKLKGAGEDRAVYRAMLETIAQVLPVQGPAMQLLATQRANAIAGYLQQQGLERSRVDTGRLASVRAGSDGEISARLALAGTE